VLWATGGTVREVEIDQITLGAVGRLTPTYSAGVCGQDVWPLLM
jgi:hypothetical protein